MNAPIRISFVIPAYNEEVLLPSCLEAIRAEVARTGAAAEVIVVNNASTDRTPEVAARVPGVLLVHEPRKGLVQARKTGFEASSGELVANIDADTLIPPGWLDKVEAEFALDPELVTLSGPYDYYDVPFRIRAAARLFYLIGFATYSFNRYVLRVGSMVQGGNFVVKREALVRAGGFDPTFTFYGEDTDIARRMAQVGIVKFTWTLMAKSSGRRLRGDGLMMTGLRYSANYIWATFFRKPFTTAWNDHR
ncbi:MAG TPA: glycosyltransferase family 2 protein [Acetobacteraceae bacterium]|nr:glycosyltransferase family 2 protein [Acetobacteraceae bacterium]